MKYEKVQRETERKRVKYHNQFHKERPALFLHGPSSITEFLT